VHLPFGPEHTLRLCKSHSPWQTVDSALHLGDRVGTEMLAKGGRSIFGAIEQELVHYQPK
jgi:hypothetical protein